MSVFSRFMDIVNSNINALLEKAEDPEKMINLMIKEMEDTLIELKTSCASRMAEEKRYERKLAEIKAAVKRWESRAMLAIEKNREDLAKEALIEKKNALSKLEKATKDLENISEIVKNNKDEINQLEDKLNSVQAKYKLMKEKERRAREEQMANESFHSSPIDHFDDLEDKIERMTAMNDLNRKKDNLEKQFSDLEGMQDIESELAELKKRMEK